MKSTLRPRGAALTAVAVLALAACSSDDPSDTGASAGTSPPAAGTTEATSPAEPFGTGCSALPAEGEGSPAGMADDPFATAAGNAPPLSTLVQALTAATLVDTLNTTPDITVLAPIDPAFEAIPPEELDGLLADTARLTAVLTHHVVPGRLAPDQLAGTHTTSNNDQLTIDGAGETFSIAAEGTAVGTAASVVCGNVQTANATVYLIDQVLQPAGR